MEGYTTIKIKGQEVGLLFGLYAVQLIFEKLGKIEVNMSEAHKSATIFKHILYCGYIGDCDAMDVKPELTARDFLIFIEECAKAGDMSPVTDAVEVYNKSTTVKEKEVKADAVDSEKKNQLIGMM